MTGPASNQFNPFATGNADAVRDLLIQQIHDRHPVSHGGDTVFRARSGEMVSLLSPMLVWMRDRHGIPLSLQQCYAAMSLRTITLLASGTVLSLHDAATDAVREVPAGDLPAEVVRTLRSYLDQLPGYDPDLPYDGQWPQQTVNMHHYALFYLAHVCAPVSAASGQA